MQQVECTTFKMCSIVILLLDTNVKDISETEQNVQYVQEIDDFQVCGICIIIVF